MEAVACFVARTKKNNREPTKIAQALLLQSCVISSTNHLLFVFEDVGFVLEACVLDMVSLKGRLRILDKRKTMIRFQAQSRN